MLLAAGCSGRPRPSAATPPADDPGCSAGRPCAASAPCIAPFVDRLNCGPADCAQMALACHSDRDCEPAWQCVPGAVASPGGTGRCAVRSCQTDSDCRDPNHACAEGGTCAPRPCTRDADCPGYCLSSQTPGRGQCWPTRGVCSTWAPRP